MAIKTWACSDTKVVFEGGNPNRFPQTLLRRAQRKLWMLDAAVDVRDLRAPPGNRLEKLSGNREGQYSIRVNDQYRICFTWRGGDAYHVELVDYH